ncbi:MAG: ATP-dependent DNA helicase [Proteobacteria bacterium]|nr:ATP-dependent DNA helicase [Pseudomonadota bacterium]
MPDIAELFAAEGVLAQALPGYRPRAGQIEMAQQVEQTLASGGQCVVEAGTGTGKTFAYLAPIMQSGMTALISTGARALQDQLSQRDIPLLAEALERNISLAVLKGRANYICKQALDDNSSKGELFADEQQQWQAIIDFSARSNDGDIRDIRGVPADSPLLSRALSTRESCDTQKCPHYNECFLYKARARARQADIVIVNHHLFLSDMCLRDEGVAEILPSRDVVLFDEAHLLPQLAPQFFGEQLSSVHLQRFLSQIERTSNELGAETEALLAGVRAVKAALGSLLEQTSETLGNGRTTAAAARRDSDWLQAAEKLSTEIKALAEMLMQHAAQEKIAQLAERALNDQRLLTTWLEAPDVSDSPAQTTNNNDDSDEEQEPIVCWAEYNNNSNNLIFYMTPMMGRTLFSKQWKQLQTVLFTSATLSVGGDFNDFCEAVGLSNANTYQWGSPYDFAKRSLLYLPKKLPYPNEPQHPIAVAEAALPLIRANSGRAFILFSSWRALRMAHDYLEPLLTADGINVLRQGDAPNDQLLAQFRQQARTVLVGSRSFWEGVDVRGGALSLLVVDKIPFTPPTDPLLAARDEWRKKRGEQPFMRNQLPLAVLLMKQVAGRLIRDYDDYGVFMIGDPRITSKGYGRTILAALPPMPVCNNGDQAADFLQRFSDADTST